MALRTALRRALAIVAVLACSTQAQAQIFRAYLASDGSDANPCTLPLPCRLLPAALNAVVSGGEIWMLDSANYNTGSVNVTKSVSILAVPGAVGSVVGTGSEALRIVTAGIVVSLRNLVIVPLVPAGGEGIYMSAASTLFVEDSLFANFPSHAALHATGNARVMISGSTFRNNAYALLLENGTRAQVFGSRLIGNTQGVLAMSKIASNTRVTVSDCLITGDTGVYAYTDFASATTVIAVTRSTIGNATYALKAESLNGGEATVLIGSSTVHNSVYKWHKAGALAVIGSYGNNQMLDYSLAQGALSPALPE